MANQSLAKRPSIDPEFQAVYDAEVHEKDCSCPACTRDGNVLQEPPPRIKKLTASETSDDFQAFAEMAKDNQQYSHRKDFREGSFGQVEHDVSNIGRLLFNVLTR